MAQRRSTRPTGREDDSPLDRPEVERRVRAVLAMGGVPWGDVEDAVQEVRLRLLEAQTNPGAERIRNPGAWSSVVASRVAIDWQRSRKRDTGLREKLAARWAERSTAHPQADRDLALIVAEGLERLTALQRQVVVLRFYADLTVRDIAGLLEVAEGTVKSRLHSAVAALRERMDEMEVS